MVRWLTLLRFHLLDRLRRVAGGTGRRLVAVAAVLGWFATIGGGVVATLMDPSQASGAIYLAAQGWTFACFVTAAVVAIDGVRPGGRWPRLSFFPLRRATMVSLLFAETLVVVFVVVAIWMIPGLGAMLAFRVITVPDLLRAGIVAGLFALSITTLVTSLGLAVSLVAGAGRLRRHLFEVVVTGVILLNWANLLDLPDAGWFHHVRALASPFPARETGHALEGILSGEPVPGPVIDMLIAWAALPCVFIALVPLRWSMRVGSMRVRPAPRARRAPSAGGVVARGAVSLPRETLRRFHVHFVRDPSLARGIVIASVAMLGLERLLLFFGQLISTNGGAEYTIYLRAQTFQFWEWSARIAASGVFAVAVMMASLVLPLERGQVTFLRLSSRPPGKLLVSGQASALLYPTLLGVLGLAVLQSFDGSRGQVAPAGLLLAAAIVLGNAFGMLMGVLFGRYDWKSAFAAHELPSRLAVVAAVIGVFRGAGYALTWLLSAHTAGVMTLRAFAIFAGALEIVLLLSWLAVRTFERRPPAATAVRTAED